MVFWTIPEFFINIFYGNRYMESVYSLKILSLSLPFSLSCGFIGIVLASINKQATAAVITGITAMLNMILNYYLIPDYDTLGAALSSLISFAFMFTVLLLSCFAFLKRRNYD